jgi:hypothetical protein
LDSQRASRKKIPQRQDNRAAHDAAISEDDMGLREFAPGARREAALPARDAATPVNRAAALLRVLQRLESVIDEEVSALRQRQAIDLDQFSRRKNRGLLELVRVGKGFGDPRSDPSVAREISRLRAKLEENYGILRLHLNAVRAVSDVICRSIREAESDGTYPASLGRRGGR